MDWFWLKENGLALYGAIVGTLALFLNVGRYWLMRQKVVRKLKVESSINKFAQSHIDKAKLGQNVEAWEGGNSVGPLYDITVKNISHVPMHIDEVGIIVRSSNLKRKERIRYHQMFHVTASSLGVDESEMDLSPGKKKTYSIRLKREGFEIPKVIGCYVVDHLGKEFTGKHSTGGTTLVMTKEASEESVSEN